MPEKSVLSRGLTVASRRAGQWLPTPGSVIASGFMLIFSVSFFGSGLMFLLQLLRRPEKLPFGAVLLFPGVFMAVGLLLLATLIVAVLDSYRQARNKRETAAEPPWRQHVAWRENRAICAQAPAQGCLLHLLLVTASLLFLSLLGFGIAARHTGYLGTWKPYVDFGAIGAAWALTFFFGKHFFGRLVRQFPRLELLENPGRIGGHLRVRLYLPQAMAEEAKLSVRLACQIEIRIAKNKTENVHAWESSPQLLHIKAGETGEESTAEVVFEIPHGLPETYDERDEVKWRIIFASAEAEELHIPVPVFDVEGIGYDPTLIPAEPGFLAHTWGVDRVPFTMEHKDGTLRISMPGWRSQPLMLLVLGSLVMGMVLQTGIIYVSHGPWWVYVGGFSYFGFFVLMLIKDMGIRNWISLSHAGAEKYAHGWTRTRQVQHVPLEQLARLDIFPRPCVDWSPKFYGIHAVTHTGQRVLLFGSPSYAQVMETLAEMNGYLSNLVGAEGDSAEAVQAVGEAS